MCSEAELGNEAWLAWLGWASQGDHRLQNFLALPSTLPFLKMVRVYKGQMQ